LYGTFYHTIDSKGRLFIPARLRDELGEKFHVTLSTEMCLMIYSKERWENATEKLKSLPQTAQMELRGIFANAAECEPDGQGRIQLRKDLRDHVGLTKNVTIVGTGVYVQIWDSDTYKPIAVEETKPENLKNVIEKYGF